MHCAAGNASSTLLISETFKALRSSSCMKSLQHASNCRQQQQFLRLWACNLLLEAPSEGITILQRFVKGQAHASQGEANCHSHALWARYMMTQHPEVEKKVLKELDELELLVTAERPHPRRLVASDLNKLTYLNCVIKVCFCSPGCFAREYSKCFVHGSIWSTCNAVIALEIVLHDIKLIPLQYHHASTTLGVQIPQRARSPAG